MTVDSLLRLRYRALVLTQLLVCVTHAVVKPLESVEVLLKTLVDLLFELGITLIDSVEASGDLAKRAVHPSF